MANLLNDELFMVYSGLPITVSHWFMAMVNEFHLCRAVEATNKKSRQRRDFELSDVFEDR
jgi:hypothetical protein